MIKKVLRVNDILLKIKIGTNENITGMMIKKLFSEIK
jgi:hypothetical protein